MLIDKLLFSSKMSSVLTKGLNLSADRQLLIASNISNADTPGYKASDMDFSKHMEEALSNSEPLKMVSTTNKHYGTVPNDTQDAEVFEQPQAARSNGNNVEMDKEMARMAENQLMYNMITQVIIKQDSTLTAAVSESASAT